MCSEVQWSMRYCNHTHDLCVVVTWKEPLWLKIWFDRINNWFLVVAQKGWLFAKSLHIIVRFASFVVTLRISHYLVCSFMLPPCVLISSSIHSFFHSIFHSFLLLFIQSFHCVAAMFSILPNELENEFLLSKYIVPKLLYRFEWLKY